MLPVNIDIGKLVKPATVLIEKFLAPSTFFMSRNE